MQRPGRGIEDRRKEHERAGSIRKQGKRGIEISFCFRVGICGDKIRKKWSSFLFRIFTFFSLSLSYLYDFVSLISFFSKALENEEVYEATIREISNKLKVRMCVFDGACFDVSERVRVFVCARVLVCVWTRANLQELHCEFPHTLYA